MTLDQEEYVEELLKKIYRRVIDWQPPVPIDSPSPFVPDATNYFQENCTRSIQTSREVLNGFSKDELVHGLSYLMGEKELAKPNKELLTQIDLASDIVSPLWYIAGFGVEGKQADFGYWAQMGMWTLDEATAVSIGFEPCEKIDVKENIGSVHADVLQFYQRRRKLIESKFYMFGDRTVHKPSPEKFCDWANKINLDIPDILYVKVSEITGVQYISVRGPHSKGIIIPDLEEREKTSLLRLVIGMAIGGYSFTPSKKRSSIPTEIRTDLNKIGLDLDLDTIRKYLKLAAAILPDDWDSSIDE